MNDVNVKASLLSGRRQRGAALVLVLMVAAVFMILMGTLIDVLAMEQQNAVESADSDAALTAAYSGVDLLILSIEEYYQNNIQNGKPPKSADCAFNEPGGGTTTTTCTAQLEQSWAGTNGLNYYLIRSTGDAMPSGSQEVARTVDALVKEVPFGAYAMFTETEKSNTGGPVWYSSGQNYGGPVYSGGQMHIRYDSSNQTPIFPDGFTTSGQVGLKPIWYDVADQNFGPPDNKNEVNSVFGSSQPSYQNGTVALPGFAQNLVVFSQAYFGDSTHDDPSFLPSQNTVPMGVYVNGNDPSCAANKICTGLFIQGDVQVQSSAVPSPGGDISSGVETWTFVQNPPGQQQQTTTVTIDFSNNTTTVLDPSGNTTTYIGVASGESNGASSLANGAIFVNGNITVLDGSVVHGQYTLAVPDPPQNGESMTLTGSLTYASDPLKGNSQDELALWANDIFLTSANNNPVIDGMILTGYANECQTTTCGGFFANSYCDKSGCNGGGMGTLTLYGSLIQNMRGKMGVVDANGNPIGGYLRADSYDPRLGANPPPFSPTTNLYSIVALSDRGYLPF